MPLSPPSKKLSAKAEEMIRTFARKQSLTELHKLYQDLNDRTEHGDHNKCYSHFLFLLGDALIKDVGLNNAESVLEYEAIFIDELFQVGLDNAIADFLDQCKDYDAVTSQLTESKVLELSEKMKTFFLYPKGVIDLDGQQSLIRHFIKLYASGQGHFLVDTKQTAFRLFLMAKKARNIFVYSNFLSRQ